MEGTVKEKFLALTERANFDATPIPATPENQLVEKEIATFRGVQAHF